MSAPLFEDEVEEEIDPLTLRIIPLLPSAITLSDGGYDELARLVGAEIIQIGTTIPGLIEGGGLIIDYRLQDGSRERLIFAFSERGMWIQYCQPFGQ